MNDQALATIDAGQQLTVDSMKNHVNIIEQMTKAVMKQNMHYGTIPGCGDKPTLLQPGAQKLALAFQLAAEPDVEWFDLPNGHREYHVKCHLISRITGATVGTGLGNCSTMESRYRFRTQATDREVPKEYWQNRDSDILGGKQYGVKKVDNRWVITEKIEHDNPADYFNTCEKMAKKRAFVDAILTATAASDHFTQDIEDNPELYGGSGTTPAATTQQTDQSAPAGNGESEPVVTFGKNKGTKFADLSDRSLSWYAEKANDPKTREHAQAELAKRNGGQQANSAEDTRRQASEADIRRIHEQCEKTDISIGELLDMFKLETTDEIRVCDVQPLIDWMDDPAKKPELPAF